MSVLLALDLGTLTGFVAGAPEHRVSGVWNLRPSRFDSAGVRYVKFRQHLVNIHKHYDIGFVAYEEVRRHLGTDAAHCYGGLLATLQAWCVEESLPYQGVPVGTIKKYATGKGNAGKRDMIRVARERWRVPTASDNEADALALFHYMAPWVLHKGAVRVGEPPAKEAA